MSIRQGIASALQFFVVFTFFLTSLFFMFLPHLPLTRLEIIDFFSRRYEECPKIGAGLFSLTLLFFFGFYFLNRGKYLVIKMGISADLKVIRQAVDNCFAKQFSKKISLKEIEIGSKAQLRFKVHLNLTDEGSREKLYAEVEKQLSILLQERFGYAKSFYLIVPPF